MKTKSTKLNIFETKKLFVLSISIIALSVFAYMYSYHLSVSYASSIQTYEDKISNIKSEISELEFELVQNKRQIDKEVAMEQGFVELKDVVYVKKTVKTALNAETN